MRENADQNNSEYGQFLNSLVLANKTKKTISHLHKFSGFFTNVDQQFDPYLARFHFYVPKKYFQGVWKWTIDLKLV